MNLAAQQVVWDKPGAQTKKTVAEPSPAYRSAYNDAQIGDAIYYADYLAGKPTAYGETYKPGEMTASHALLPMGTILEVKRLDSGSSVRVRVNDNNGHADGSLVVISRQAAYELGMLNSGRTKVIVKRVGFDNWNPKPRTATSTMTARSVTAAPSTYSRVQQPSSATVRTTPSQPYYRPASYSSGNRSSATANSTNTAYQDPYAYREARSVDAQQASSTPPVYTGYKTTTDVSVAEVQEAVPVRRPDNAASSANRAAVQPANYTPVTYKRVTHQPANAAPAIYGTPVQAAAVAPVQEVQVVSNKIQHGYGIQLAAYGNMGNAQRQVQSLQSQGVDNIYIASVSKSDGTTINRVMVGPFANAGMAQKSADELLRTRQLSGIVTKLR